MTKDNLISKQDISKEKTLSGWDKAIQDAEKGIHRLTRAIEVFRERKAAKEPWPGEARPQI